MFISEDEGDCGSLWARVRNWKVVGRGFWKDEFRENVYHAVSPDVFFWNAGPLTAEEVRARFHGAAPVRGC